MKFVSALCLVVAVCGVTSESLPGTCPSVTAEINFNATAFAGIWFDQAHSPRHTGLELKCDLVKFTAPSHTKLTFNSYTYSSATKKIISVSGDADVPTSEGKMNVHIPSIQLGGEVRVVTTDYVTFAVLYTCKEGSGVHEERVLILTREKNPSASLLTAAERVLENKKISKKDLSYSRQHKCHDYDLNATGLSNSLSTATSMGSLLSVHASNSPATSTSTTTTTSATTSKDSAGGNIAKQAQKVWHSITG